MRLSEFIKKYEGKHVDFDKALGNQCVDLYRQYCQEFLGFSQSPAVVGADQIWSTFLKDKFTAIKNEPPLLPKPGDVIIWGKGIGKYGHVGIFISGDLNSFTSFDQNYPAGSVCSKVRHNYKNVIGWLTPCLVQV